MEIVITLPEEQATLIGEKLGYTETIQVDSGKRTDDDKTIYVEKSISLEDFLHNWYSQLMDSDAVQQKRRNARMNIDTTVNELQLESPIQAKIPTPTKAEINAAVLQSKQK